MRKGADKFPSIQGWIVDLPVDSGLIYSYKENKIKEPPEIKIRNNDIFECDVKSCSQYKMFRVGMTQERRDQNQHKEVEEPQINQFK